MHMSCVRMFHDTICRLLRNVEPVGPGRIGLLTFLRCRSLDLFFRLRTLTLSLRAFWRACRFFLDNDFGLFFML